MLCCPCQHVHTSWELGISAPDTATNLVQLVELGPKPQVTDISSPTTLPAQVRETWLDKYNLIIST